MCSGRFLVCPIPAERRVLIHACVESRLLHAALACQNLITLAGTLLKVSTNVALDTS